MTAPYLNEKTCKTCAEKKSLEAYPKVKYGRRGNICCLYMYAAQKERDAVKKIEEESRILKNRKFVIPTTPQSWWSALEAV